MGILFVVSTPIGNLEDITIRAIRALLRAPLIACEDTRHAGILLTELEKRYGVLVLDPLKSREYIRIDEFKEAHNMPILIERLEQGEDVVLISDAGTPLVSDPGYQLVRAAIKRAIHVIALPGPTAFVHAATLSGFPMQPLVFWGFPPEKPGKREKLLEKLVQKDTRDDYNATHCFYVSPHKLDQFLQEIQTIIGDIPLVVARELTKLHETVFRGRVSEACAQSTEFKGECVVLFQIL